MPASQDSVWLVVPTYNERENISSLVEAVLSRLPSARVLVVDDNSPDGTGAVADELAEADPRVHVLHRPGKEGLGAAYRAGFAHVLNGTQCQIVIQMDCDFSHDPADLPRLVSGIEAGCDLVLGSRYVSGGLTPGWSRLRRLLSIGGSHYSRTLLGVPYRDLTGGFKAWRAGLLETILADVGYANGYGFQVEMTFLAHRHGARIEEIPISFHDRTAGKSKMSGAIVLEALLAIPRLRLTARRLAAQPRGAGRPT